MSEQKKRIKFISLLDYCCVKIMDLFTIAMRFLFIPFKFILYPLTKHFQRPFSLCFIFNFFCLMTPCLLIFIVLMQNFSFIFYTKRLFFLTLLTLLFLIVNYISLFYIYEVYGRHSLKTQEEGQDGGTFNNFNKSKLKYSLSEMTKYLIIFSFKETKIGFLGLLYLIELILSVINISLIFTNGDFNSDIFDLPIIITFLKLGMIINVLFTFFCFFIYLSVVSTIYCKLNNSCCCNFFQNNFNVTKNQEIRLEENIQESHIHNSSNVNSNISMNFTPLFVKNLFEFYKFLGIFDVKKFFNEQNIEIDENANNENYNI